MEKREVDVNRNVITENLEAYAKYLTEHMDCIICGKANTEVWARYGSYTAVKCEKCGLVWMDPHLSEEGLNKYYDDYIGMRAKDEIKTKQRATQYQLDKEFIEGWVSSGRVLDVGCSGGFFLDALSDSFEKHGIDIDGKAVEHAKKSYGFGKNVNCVRLEDVTYPNGYFDLVVMRGAIEHLPDPKTSIKKVSSLLKKGGYFYIAATPNVDSFSADLYREKWNMFHPVRHLFYFGAATLSKLCSPSGLKLVGRHYPYEETPYANIENDHAEVLKAWKLKEEGRFDEVGRSPSFWGNMMNLIFKKL
jgi:2-polyprenyl-3-methyl-5-hydroxy-6-metoxy-1,4-benzoquinol methylase